MPNLNTPKSGTRHRGWHFDALNGVLEAYYNSTVVFRSSASATTLPQNTTASGTFTSTGAATMSSTLAVAGISTLSDELRVANGKNIRVGTISAFGTTEPTNAIVFKTGTEFAGAITTSGGLMSSNTVVRKIIADGTASNVEA